MDFTLSHAKRYKLTLALVLFMALLCTSALNADSGFVRYFDISAEIVPDYTTSPSEVRPQAIYTTSDNGAVVLAMSEWAPDEMQVWYALTVVKLDSLGNEIWQRYYRPDNLDVINVTGIGINYNDNVSALYCSDNGCLYQVNIDSNGNISRVLLNSGSPFIWEIIKALRDENGNLVTIGRGSYDVAPYSYISFAKYSASGQLIQSFPIVDSTYYNARATDAIVDDDGNVLIACRLKSEYLEVIKIDGTGSIIDRIELPGYLANTMGQYFIHLSHIPASEHILAVYQYEDGPPWSGSHITSFVRITDTGIDIQSFNDSILSNPFSIVEFVNGVYVFAFNTDPLISGAIYRFDFNEDYSLNWMWHDSQIDLAQYILPHTTDLLSIGQGNCIFAVEDLGYQGISVAKVLSNGQVPLADEVQTPELIILKVYPNPMTDVLNISFNKQAKSHDMNDLISIFNIRGQLVWQLAISSDISEVVVQWDGRDNNGKKVPCGIYIIKVSDTWKSFLKLTKSDRR